MDIGTVPVVQGIDLFLAEVAAARPEARELQFAPGVPRLDLTWGHPDPTLLPVEEMGRAAEAVLAGAGWRALSYGASEGSGRLRSVLAERLSAAGHPVGPDELVVTFGSSGAFDLLLGVAATAGDVVVVEQPTYFLALRVLADRGLRAVGLPVDTAGDGDGPAPALDATVRRLRAEGHRGRTFLYLCPTHANPTGRTLTEAARRALVATAEDHDVVLVEDDVYGELGATGATPLWALAPERTVRLGSFSKTIAPGLRLGYLRAPRPLAAAVAGCGFLDSGGGANPFVAAVVAEMVATGAYDAVVERLTTAYRERMAAVLSAVDDAFLPAGRPTGGYFAWLRAPHTDLVARAAAEGVAVAPAGPFHVDAVDGAAARVSCSLLGPADLAEASRRLARALVPDGTDTPATGSGGLGGQP